MVFANSQYVDALINGAEMSQKQAEVFANTYTVVDQYTDPGSEFSATVFRGATGKIFFAICGSGNPFTFGDSAGAIDLVSSSLTP